MTDEDRELVPGPLVRGLRKLESSHQLDGIVGIADDVAAKAGAGARGRWLRGDWLGHALHPLLTDFPLGCWLSAGLLDVSGSTRFRPAARRLVGLGVGFAIPTALTGVAEYGVIDDRRQRRVGVVHAAGNTAVLALYALSWRARRTGHHGRGVALALAGGSAAWITGYLGGHLSFARQVGTGQRGMDIDAPRMSPDDAEIQEALLANGAVPAATAGGGRGLAGPNSL